MPLAPRRPRSVEPSPPSSRGAIARRATSIYVQPIPTDRSRGSTMHPAPYLRRLALRPGAIPKTPSFPLSLPFVPTLDIAFPSAVTFLVGENGSGKSTVIEAIADLSRLPVSGGGRNEIGDTHGPGARASSHPRSGRRSRARPAKATSFAPSFRPTSRRSSINGATTQTSGATRTHATADARCTRDRTVKPSSRCS